MSGKPTPAIGFATGMGRIIVNLKKHGVSVPTLPRPQVFIAYVGDEAKDEAKKLVSTLRRNGIGVVEAPGSKSLKAQVRQANPLGAHYAVIIEEQQIKTGTVILRDMTIAQKNIPLDQLPWLLGN